MNKINIIKKLILKKMQNVISDAKANDVLEKIGSEYPDLSFDEAIEKIQFYPDLPSWLKSLVTVNETFFFRHPEHFNYVKEYIKNLGSKDLVEVFCMGVSSGQEAYSLAMLFEEYLPKDIDYKITGIDINADVIKRAKEGIYTEIDITRTPAPYRDLLMKYLQNEETPTDKYYLINESIKRKVSFITGNIFQSLVNRANIIFARNILIYFEETDRAFMIQKLKEKLKLGGFLLIGAGELFPQSFKHEVSSKNTSILEMRAA